MMTNQQTMGEFAKNYSQMTDAQLLGLYAEREVFLPESHSALLAELQKRFLTESAAVALAEHRVAVERARKSCEGEDADLLGGVFGRR